MWSKLVETVLLFKPFFLFTIAATLVLLPLSLLLCRNLSFDRWRMRYYGLFYALRTKGLLQLSLGLLQLSFLISCVLFQVRMEPPHAIFLALLCVGYHLFDLRLGAALFDMLNVGVLYSALLAQNLLTAYLKQVQFEWTIWIVSLLLGLFSIQYALYFLIKNIGSLLEYKPRERRKRHAKAKTSSSNAGIPHEEAGLG